MTSLTLTRASRLKAGDVVVRHPDHPERLGEWTVMAPPRITGILMVEIDYRDAADMKSGEFVVETSTELLVRLPENLTPEQRMALYHEMTEPEHWSFIAHVKNNHPAIFDDAAAYVTKVRAEDKAAGR